MSKVIQHKSAEAIVVCDTFGKINNCNSMAEQMFGTSLSFLLAHNKNIKWFMPKNIADRHDGYLSAFRDNLNAGSYDVSKSTIIGKTRSMQGRRPGDAEDEVNTPPPPSIFEILETFFYFYLFMLNYE